MNRKQNFIPAFNFDFLTPFYDTFVSLLGYGDGQRNKVIDLLSLKSRETLLDVGCGTGTLLVLAKKRFPTVEMVGIDPDQKILSLARNKATKQNLNIHFVKAGAESIPFKDAGLDVVVSTLIFHHLPTEIKKQALKEIYRILKKDGRFLLVDFGKADSLLFKFLYSLEKLIRLPEAKTAEDNIEGRIPQFLEEAGFKVKEVAPRYRGLQFLLAKKL